MSQGGENRPSYYPDLLGCFTPSPRNTTVCQTTWGNTSQLLQEPHPPSTPPKHPGEVQISRLSQPEGRCYPGVCPPALYTPPPLLRHPQTHTHHRHQHQLQSKPSVLHVSPVITAVYLVVNDIDERLFLSPSKFMRDQNQAASLLALSLSVYLGRMLISSEGPLTFADWRS